MYGYIESEPNLWTVGFYAPDGEWIPESDHDSSEKAAKRVHYLNGGKGGEFIPTLGNLIKEMDDILKNVPPYLRNDYAKLFDGTETENFLFSTKKFEEEASEYCREAGWREPK